MLETIRTSLANQLEAALCTLSACVERCPDAVWDAPVVNLAFCQVVLHTLIYADFYLGPDEDSFRRQPFHRERASFFRDYEEFEDRKPRHLYDKPAIRTYLDFCRQKAADAIAAETAESLAAPCGFPRRHFSRVELYVYVTRHIQHHAANLGLHLRRDVGEDVPWCASGWREV